MFKPLEVMKPQPKKTSEKEIIEREKNCSQIPNNLNLCIDKCWVEDWVIMSWVRQLSGLVLRQACTMFNLLLALMSLLLVAASYLGHLDNPQKSVKSVTVDLKGVK